MARQVLDNGIVLPSEYSDDWYDDMTSNLTKLDEVIGSDAEKLDESDVGAAAISNDYDDLDNLPTFNVLRRAAVTLTAGGTGNYSDLDSDSKIKAGDYVLDAANKLYSITAIDAANSTYTVSAASIINITDKSELGAAALSNDYDDLNNLPGYGILRFCSTAITDNSNVAFANISSVSKIAAGDFLLDTAGKMYVIASVDTVNETAAVTTPLTQLAVDSSVMHLSRNESVGGSKTFTWPIAITSYPSIRMYLTDDEWNVQPASAKQSEIRFTDKNAVLISYIAFQHRPDENEPFRTCFRQQKMDGTSGYFSVNFNNLGEFYPENYNSIKLGTSTRRWKDCQTYLVNGLTPSSLSMPSGNFNDIIDISGYLTYLDGTANTYTAPANGWILITLSNSTGIQAYINGLWGHQIVRPSAGAVRFLMPITKNLTVNILIFGGAVDNARFIPCQGNV